MTPEEVYRAWSPEAAKWSPWVKPVVFAHLHAMPAESEPAGVTHQEMAPLPLDADGTTAIVVDLPSAEGVQLGLALAARGFRPVPLYNAVPLRDFQEAALARR